MPRDNDKNNDSRGRRDRPSGGKGRSGAARGPEKKFAKRAGKEFAGKSDGERKPYAGKADGAKSYCKKPSSGPATPSAATPKPPPPRRHASGGVAPRCRRTPGRPPPRYRRGQRQGPGRAAAGSPGGGWQSETPRREGQRARPERKWRPKKTAKNPPRTPAPGQPTVVF